MAEHEVDLFGKAFEVEGCLHSAAPACRVTFLYGSGKTVYRLRRLPGIAVVFEDDKQAVHARDVLIDCHSQPVRLVEGQEVADVLLEGQLPHRSQHGQRDGEERCMASKAVFAKEVVYLQNHVI